MRVIDTCAARSKLGIESIRSAPSRHREHLEASPNSQAVASAMICGASHGQRRPGDLGLHAGMSRFAFRDSLFQLYLARSNTPQTNKFPLRAERIWDFSPAQSRHQRWCQRPKSAGKQGRWRCVFPMLARPPSANYARARLARLGIHPAHPRPPPAGLPAVSSRWIAHNCQQHKSISFWAAFSLASQPTFWSHAGS